jgi:multisubunit Na+/H+ antiporter MnhB subunit
MITVVALILGIPVLFGVGIFAHLHRYPDDENDYGEKHRTS